MAKQNPIEEAERTTQLVLVPAKGGFYGRRVAGIDCRARLRLASVGIMNHQQTSEHRPPLDEIDTCKYRGAQPRG